jgi:hypothetical protein
MDRFEPQDLLSRKGYISFLIRFKNLTDEIKETSKELNRVKQYGDLRENADFINNSIKLDMLNQKIISLIKQSKKI